MMSVSAGLHCGEDLKGCRHSGSLCKTRERRDREGDKERGGGQVGAKERTGTRCRSRLAAEGRSVEV